MTHLFGGLPERLRRVTTSGDYIPQVDGLRFVAVFMVLCSHLNSRVLRMYQKEHVLSAADAFFYKRLVLGNLGVELFFVVSGFIIAFPFLKEPLEGKPVSLRRYYWRRVTRLEPPYMISLTVILLFLIVSGYRSSIMGRYGTVDDPMLGGYLASLVYLHGPLLGRISELNPPTWSLELEVQFYFVAPLLLYLYVGRWGAPTRRGVVAIALASLVVTQLTIADDEVARKLFALSYIHFFILGIVLCELISLSKRFRCVPAGHLWDFGGAAGLVILYVAKRGDPFMLHEMLKLVAISLVFLGAFRGTAMGAVLGNRWLTSIGGMCYSIYLLHLPVMQVLVEQSMRIVTLDSFLANFVLQALVIIPLLLVIAGVFFLAVEKPCMDREWPRKLRRRVRIMTGREPQPMRPEHGSPEVLLEGSSRLE